jgi:serine/threonine protein kinase
LFSFGVVLYEMATGFAPFHGDTAAAVFNEILNKTPAPTARLNPAVPARLQDILDKLLEKDPNLRYQSARDVLSDIRRLRRDSDSSRSAAPIAAPSSVHGRSRRTLWITAASVVVLTAAIAAGFLIRGAQVRCRMKISFWSRTSSTPPGNPFSTRL